MAELPIKYVKDNNGKFVPITSPNAVIDENGNNINELFIHNNDILDLIYPIGSIYITTATNTLGTTSPARWLGGTWEQIKDAFLWASGDTTSFTYTENGTSVTKSLIAGSVGGEITHTLTVDEMPIHTHGQKSVAGDGNINPWYANDNGNSSGNQQPTAFNWSKTKGGRVHTSGEGGDLPHNNMPPYLAVYMWERIA